MTADEPMIIDWVDATIGNPVADVARTSVVLLGHIKSTGVDESATDGLKRISSDIRGGIHGHGA